jgi:CheY-like chemotaxis protein
VFSPPLHSGMDMSKPILLVESNEDDAKILKTAFVKAHVLNPADVIVNEGEARQYLMQDGAANAQEHLPALAILALPHPTLRDFSLLRWIRSQPELQALQVLVLSGINIGHEDAKEHELGSDCYSEKLTDFPSTVQLAKRLDERFLKPLSSKCGVASSG